MSEALYNSCFFQKKRGGAGRS